MRPIKKKADAIAREAVKEIMADLLDRQGIKHEIRQCKLSVQQEIFEALTSIVRSHIEPLTLPTGDRMKLIKVDFKGKHTGHCCVYHKALRMAEKKALARSGDDEPRYLCKKSYRLFVSQVSLLERPDGSLPENCPTMGCLYVEPPGKSPLMPVEELDEMYRIVEE